MKKTQVTQKSEKPNPPQVNNKTASTANDAQKKTQINVASTKGVDASNSKGSTQATINQAPAEKQLINTLVQEQKEIIKPVVIESSLSELLGKFMHLKCSQHKIREYDHICVNKQCPFTNVISCSKCILQDEKHSKECKNDFNSLEKYVPTKVDQLSGRLEREKIEFLQQQVKKTEEDVAQRIALMRQTVEKDITEIIGSVTALCSELKVALIKQIDQYEEEQKNITKKYNNDLKKNHQQIIKEGSFIENEFKAFLTNNFDYENFYQVNEFMRKVREKENTFSVQRFILELQDNLEEFKYDLKNNNYYKTRKVAFMKEQIYSLLQEALKNSTSAIDSTKQPQTTLNSAAQFAQNGQDQVEEQLNLFDFNRLKLQGQHLANHKKQQYQDQVLDQVNQQGQDAVIEEFIDDDRLQEWQTAYDKKSIIMDVPKDLKDATNDSSMISLQQKALMMTDHKLAMNSIAIINHNSFATCGNEHKVKIWGFTHNYIIHIKAVIELGDLGVQLAYNKQNKCLYVATSRGAIQIYQLPDDVSTAVDLNPKLIKEFVGHERTVRNIAFLPNSYNQLVSLSYDKTIKFWSTNDAVEQQDALMFSSELPNDEDCKYLEANGQYTIVGTISGNILIYQNVLVDLNQQQTLQSSIKSRKSDRSVAFIAPVRRQPKYQVVEIRLLAKLKCSKEKITSIVLGSKNPHLAIIGSGNGTISVLDLSKLNIPNPSPIHHLQSNLHNLQSPVHNLQFAPPTEVNNEDELQERFGQQQLQAAEICIVHKFRHIHKQRICSLNLFEDNFLIAMSWDGLTNLYDLKKQKAISTTKYQLQNDEKKHSDGASAKIVMYDTNKYHILSIGNNDKQVQVFTLQLKKCE